MEAWKKYRVLLNRVIHQLHLILSGLKYLKFKIKARLK
ncbi:hypothetical protein GQL89_16305 [Escherichia coli]|nr:hypothetical protein [Escherichia coli]